MSDFGNQLQLTIFKILGNSKLTWAQQKKRGLKTKRKDTHTLSFSQSVEFFFMEKQIMTLLFLNTVDIEVVKIFLSRRYFYNKKSNNQDNNNNHKVGKNIQ